MPRLDRCARTGSRTGRGHTLVELMMSIAISSGALALAFGGFSTLMAMLKSEQKVTECQLDHAEIFTLLENDIRNAGADPRSAGLYSGSTPAVEIVPSGQPLAGGLALRSDRTGDLGLPDGDINDPEELVVYSLDSNTGVLSRWVATGTGGMMSSTLLRSVISFTVDFQDATGTSTTAAAATLVHITLSSQVNPGDPRLNAPIRQQTFSIVLQNRLMASR